MGNIKILFLIKFGKLGGRIVLWDIDEKMNLQTKGILDDLGIQVGGLIFN